MNGVIGSELLIDGNRSVAAGWTEDRVEIGEKLSALGTSLVRYGLVLVILWIGVMKNNSYLGGRNMKGLLILISALFIFASAGCATSITTGAAKNSARGQQQQVEATQVELERQRAKIERLKRLDEFTPDW